MIRRREYLWAPFLGVALLSTLKDAHAGGQVQEVLSDSVRTALSSSVKSGEPPAPEFRNTEEKLAYLRWLASTSDRLKSKFSIFQSRKEFLQTVWYESKRARLDQDLVLGLIEVESNFRKFAVSHVGARGYMQVMPFWTRQIGDGDPGKLFHMQTNIRFGCVILRHYLDLEKDNLMMALGRYNGSRGQTQYPNAVLKARQKWQYADTAKKISP